MTACICSKLLCNIEPLGGYTEMERGVERGEEEKEERDKEGQETRMEEVEKERRESHMEGEIERDRGRGS